MLADLSDGRAFLQRQFQQMSDMMTDARVCSFVDTSSRNLEGPLDRQEHC